MFFWLYFFCIMFAARCFDLEACFGTDVYDFNWARALISCFFGGELCTSVMIRGI
jgi:hypothetical protein